MSTHAVCSCLTLSVYSAGSARPEWVTAVHPLILDLSLSFPISPSLPLPVSVFQVTEVETDIREALRRALPLPSLPSPPSTLSSSRCIQPPHTTSAWIWRTAEIAHWPGAAAPKTPSITPPPWTPMSVVCLPRSPTARVKRSRPSTMSRGCTTAGVWRTWFTMKLMSILGKVSLP